MLWACCQAPSLAPSAEFSPQNYRSLHLDAPARFAGPGSFLKQKSKSPGARPGLSSS